jgi:hypothetical protein
MNMLGVGHGGRWFLDLETLLHSIAVQRHGIDPYTLPYDIQHWYSHWWLLLEPTGVSRADTLWLGAVITACVVAAVCLLVRPRTLGEVGWTLAVFGSARGRPRGTSLHVGPLSCFLGVQRIGIVHYLLIAEVSF